MSTTGRPYEAKTSHQARGCRRGSHIKIVCAFDEDTFATVRKLAVKEQTSVAEQIRKLVEWGLEADNTGGSNDDRRSVQRLGPAGPRI
jgi:hypothetical protein